MLETCPQHGILPNASYFLSNLSPMDKSLTIAGTVFTTITIILASLEWSKIYSYVSSEKLRAKLYWIISVYPILALTSLSGLLAPRTAVIINDFAILFLLSANVVFISAAKQLLRGRHNLVSRMESESEEIIARNPPCCCCCLCLPTIKPTISNIKKFEWLVLQAPIVKLLILFVELYLSTEDNMKLRIAGIFNVPAILLSVYGCHSFMRMVGNKLDDYKFGTIFKLLDLTLLLGSAQEPLLFQNLLGHGFKVFSCTELLSTVDRATYIWNFTLICQSLLLSGFMFLVLLPKKNSLFGGQEDSQSQRLALAEKVELQEP